MSRARKVLLKKVEEIGETVDELYEAIEEGEIEEVVRLSDNISEMSDKFASGIEKARHQ